MKRVLRFALFGWMAILILLAPLTKVQAEIDASSFAAYEQFNVGDQPRGVSIADLDGDGRPDVAVANYAGNSVSILANTGTSGNIGFAPQIFFSVGNSPRNTVLSDLDGDGKLDLVTANQDSLSVSVLHNTSISGSINFASQVQYAVANNPYLVTAGDLDGDNRPELVTVNYLAGTVSVLRNTSTSGNISFDSHVQFPVEARPQWIAVGDLDGDGRLDLATANSTGQSISVLRNTSSVGSITFESAVNFGTGGQAFSVAMSDLDGDGKLDLAAVLLFDLRLVLLRNTSSTGVIDSSSFAPLTQIDGLLTPASLSVGYLDWDDKPEIVISNLGDNSVSVLMNTSQSGNITFAAPFKYPTARANYAHAIGDVNGDGKPDLVVSDFETDTVSVLRNTTFRDIIPPDTSFTSQPDDPSPNTSGSFGFTSDEVGSTFECKLDVGDFSACSSPVEYTSLGASSHTFQVRAIDPAGNVDPTPASYTWTINPRPVCQPVSLTTNEGAPGSTAPNCSDVGGGELSYSVSTAEHGNTAVGSGLLSYTPADNFFGLDSFTYTAFDGTFSSQAVTVTVTINPVNDAPSFTAGPNQTVNEDAGPQSAVGWATGISRGPSNEDGQTLTFSIVSNSNPTLFGVLPAVAANGTLTYTPAANAHGTAEVSVRISDDGGTANGGVDTSAAQTFTITVNSVNDAPSFTAGTNQSVLEDSIAQTAAGWATNLSAGPADEAGQVLNFLVSNNNNGLFSIQPAVGASGTLTYTPAANANGTATVTVRIHDNGGTANGGVDTSVGQTFTITVTAVNDVPSFTAGPNQTVNEDAGPQSAVDWATGISRGPSNEDSQTLTFSIVSNSNPTLFGVLPAVAATGTLTYTPAANAHGTAEVSVRISDDGGTANGGVDTSAAQTFTITVNSVNDAPSFTAGTNQSVLEDSIAQTAAGWATNLSAGPADEAGQVLDFLVSNNNNGLFSVQPAVGASGTLTYTPAANANGIATVTVRIHDDGGTANGGVDTSVGQTFTITVTAVNDVPAGNSDSYEALFITPMAVSSPGVLANDSDVDGDTLTAVLEADVTNGTLTLNSDGSFTYTPNLGYYGPDSFTYRCFDGAVQSPEITVSITVKVFNIFLPLILR